MKKTTIGVLAALCLTACEPIPTVDFKDSMPDKDTVKLEMPKASGQGGLITQDQALKGDGSGMFGLTALTVLAVNGYTLWVLGGLSAVASQEPSSVVGDTAIFGPYTPFLSETTWRLTVKRAGPNVFDYTLEGKPKAGADTEYETVLTGEHEVAISDQNRPLRGYGEGHFTIQWDQVTRLSNATHKKGTAEFRYSRMSPSAKVTVEVDTEEFVDGATTPNTAKYRYAQVPAGEGSFEFGVDTNIHWFDPAKTANERLSIKSRWNESGEGRADARISGGDLVYPGMLNECWDSRFKSTYLARSDNWEQWGTESTDCFYKSAEYTN